ncbi:hypothetical protein HMPREF1148_1292 [Selenomonas sp. FOBRC6]|nr:hypothetical protein HMPREF1148_1292 [Selenomonas sp. FOBRC6]
MLRAALKLRGADPHDLKKVPTHRMLRAAWDNKKAPVLQRQVLFIC